MQLESLRGFVQVVRLWNAHMRHTAHPERKTAFEKLDFAGGIE